MREESPGNKGSLLGKQFGSYRLVKEIARGGFGTVYQAQHMYLPERLVAVKVLHDRLLNSSQERTAFLREAQLLEKLKHPFVLPLLDVGIQQNIPFLITEYAASGSLRMRLQTLSPQLLASSEILTILSQVGQALQHAHQQKIIHRDLKPDNILFNKHGDALLADFGIATLLSTESIRQTSVTGTPPYMAPEQFRGQVSKETDQYSLGCIAYELFTGRKPFTASDFIALGFKHASEEPIPPRQLNSNVSEQVEQAILKAMAKERSQRHPNVIAFITALTVSGSKQSASKASQPQDRSQPLASSATVPEPSLNWTTEKIWAALSYLFPPLTHIFYGFYYLFSSLLGKRRGNQFISFHLFQSILLFALSLIIILIPFDIVLNISVQCCSTLPVWPVAIIYTILFCLLLLYVLLNIKFMYSVLSGKSPRFPLIWKFVNWLLK